MTLLRIDKNELKALLQSDKDGIGFNIGTEIVNVAGGLSLIVSALSLGDLRWLTVPCFTLGIALIFISARHLINMKRKPLNADLLFQEIIDMDKVERRSSIAAIRDSFETYPHRYLVYYDEGWKCEFFPNHKTADEGNPEKLKKFLSEELEIDESSISLSYLREFSNEKESTEHNNQKRLYIYNLFKAEISDMPDKWKQDEFMIAGKKYRWMSIDEMLQDETIRRINSDVISEVRDYA